MITSALKKNISLQWMRQQHQREGNFQNTLNSEFSFTPLASYDQPLDFKHLNEDKIKEFTQIIIDETHHTYDKIAQLDDSKLSFDTVFRPQIELEDKLARLSCMAMEMASFSPSKEVRDACNQAKEALSELSIETQMRTDVFKKIQAYYQTVFKSEPWLSDEEKLFVENSMEDYRRNGLHLDEKSREEVKRIQKAIDKNCIQFNKNLDEVNTSFTFSKAQLKGLPQSWFTDDKKVGKDLYKVTLQYPDYFAIMDSAQDRSARKKINLAFGSRCKEVNLNLFEETVKLRQQLAELLGYEQFSDYQLEPKMAGETSFVMNFLNHLSAQFKPLLEHDLSQYRQLASEETGKSNFKLENWDLRYYARMHEEQFCDLDQNEVRKYFPLKAVTEGMMEVYEKLLGLKFVLEQTDNKWDESVQLYRVYDYDYEHHHQGKAVGSFYLDLYPREGKYGHAAVFDFINGGDVSTITGKQGQRQLPVMAMACNFPEKECLRFDDVVTLFHEFGHVMHGICSKTQISSLASFAVKEDFIEAPSQMLEFWCYSPEVLRIMSRHEETGQPIPNEMIDKLIKEKKVNQGYISERQLSFGLFDMAMHTKEVASKRTVDSQHKWFDICEQVTTIRPDSSTAFPASFGHLMGGYEAGYYGYMMSLTYATDMFYSFFKGNELDPQQGKRYRKCILEPGGSKDAMEILRDFLGREPNNQAFLKDKGLESEEVHQQRKIKMKQ